MTDDFNLPHRRSDWLWRDGYEAQCPNCGLTLTPDGCTECATHPRGSQIRAELDLLNCRRIHEQLARKREDETLTLENRAILDATIQQCLVIIAKLERRACNP